MSYNYYEEMHSDVLNVMDDYVKYYDYDTTHDRDELEEKLFDDLFIADSVTGNASGSYTFNRYTAKEYITDNMDLLIDALNDFGYEYSEIGKMFLNEDYETFDVIIRCHILSEVIADVLDDLEKDGYFESEKNA